MTATVAPNRPRVSVLDRGVAIRLMADEYERTADLVESLGPDDWGRPTDCALWDVHDMVAHMLGMTVMAGSLAEIVRQNARAARRGGGLDNLTAVQVEERAGQTGPQLAAAFRAAGRKTAAARAGRPAWLRRLPMPEDQVVGPATERWSIGYLNDVILTRDPFMHRIDISRATGRELVLSAGHDGVLVADIAAEWAARLGRPCTLRLTGPAGGSWTFGSGAGSGGEELEMDAVEFAREVSGRGTGEGVLGTFVPF
jgi:uncharacterized protein (TIGR03083 family)